MDHLNLRAVTKGMTPDETDLSAINAQTLSPLTLDDVFCFRLVACDDQVDRDGERFPVSALQQMQKLFIGKPILRDHDWSAEKQCGRIYAADVEKDGERTCLVLRAYMLRTAETEPTIRAIEGGILRECSVGVSCGTQRCSVCGESYAACKHRRGESYSGKTCVVELADVQDAYELSLVAVPAQPGAGTIKGAKLPDKPDPDKPAPEDVIRLRLRLAAR